MTPARPERLSAASAPYGWPIPVEDARGRLIAGHGLLELRTSRPEQPVLRVRLPMTNATSFHRSQCA